MITAVAVYRMNVRLFRTTETALAGLRVRAFRHVHDLSVLHQQGAAARLAGLARDQRRRPAVGVHAVGRRAGPDQRRPARRRHRGDGLYSWQLTLLVLACFVPLGVAVRWFAKRLAAAYGVVRERVGDVLAAVAESVVGAPTVRAYGVRHGRRRASTPPSTGTTGRRWTRRR